MASITPEEFEDEMNDIFTDVYPDTIVDAVHSVCGLLQELGYEEGALVFRACVNDWFDTYIFDEEGSLNDLCDAGRI